MSDEQSAANQLERWIRSGATIIGPVSVLGALLFYFGYVSARSQYEYFGVDVDTIGLGTQDYIMRSPQPLLVPLLVLTLIAIGALALHAALRQRIATAVAGAGETEESIELANLRARQVRHIRRLARGAVTVGLAGLGLGVILLFIYAVLRDWAFYNLVTPLLIASGAALIAYGSGVLQMVRQSQSTETVPAAEEHSILLRRALTVLLYVIIAVGVFWTTATVAQWSGRGLAQDQAQNLSRLPSVILDTKERLYLRSPGIEETRLPESEGQTFNYRYRHLRLLIVGHDRMFLVPDAWSASNSTLIVPLDGSTRVQFQFQNQPP